MISNYFKIAWRNLTKNRSHAFINLFGLAIGIACCLLILLWVNDELSYDRWNEKAGRTWRITPEINFGGEHNHYAVSPAPMAEMLVTDFPEVEAAMRFRTTGSWVVNKDNLSFNEPGVVRCDPTIFDVFSLKLLKGEGKEGLEQPNTMVVTEKIADRYFPNEDPIGKTLKFDNRLEYMITGVVEELPSNTHFNVDIFLTLVENEEAKSPVWTSNNFHTYYVLRDDANAAAFQAKVFPHVKEKYLGPQLEQFIGMTYDDIASSGAFIKYHHERLTDIHLHSDKVVEMSANGSMQYVWIFSIAALFILLIACVNFMNLSTARSSVRAKEIGVRKVLGSMRSNLINQFLVESILMAGLAFLIGITLAQIALPYYNELADKQLSLPLLTSSFWVVSITGIVVIGLLAGSYPAFYLSGFRPIKSLSGKLFDTKSNFNLRNGLVVFQFMIAILLIIGTLVINQQLQFIQNKNLGFNREQVLILDNAEPLREKAMTLKQELLKKGGINHVTVSGYLPIPSSRSDSPLCKSAKFDEGNCVQIQFWNIDEDYFNTFGMDLVDGRNFNPEMATDSNAVIINETAARMFGFEDPIGQNIFRTDDFGNPDAVMTPHKIIGVVKDFHFESLRENISAVSMWLNPGPGYISMKVSTEDIPTLLADVERTWKDFAPGLPFAYRFMDDSFNQMYSQERRISSIISLFSGLSIFIACLGLFGLAAFATERRTKEIGVRKVLGASVSNLVALLSKDFLKLVGISLIISIPLAWYAMNYWLEDFAYRINISWWIFALAGVGAILIAFLTVSLQSIKAALMNPIKSLRSE